MYYKSDSQNRHVLFAAMPLALIILFVLFAQFDAPTSLAQQEPTLAATDIPSITATTTVDTPTVDESRQSVEYASIAHALRSEAIVAQEPFLAYGLAVQAGSIDNPPGEAHAALLSMVFDNYALNTISLEPDISRALRFNSDGTTAIVLTSSGHLNEYDLTTREQLHSYVAPRGYIAGADFSPDASQLILSQPDNQLLLFWDVATGRARRLAVGQPLSLIRLTPDGQHALVTTYYDSSLIYWDLVENAEILRLEGHNNSVTSMSLSPDGSLALVGYYDGTVLLYDLTTGNLLRNFQSIYQIPIYAVEFNTTGNRAFVGTESGALLVWGIGSGQLLYEIPRAHRGAILDIAFSSDRQYFATGANNGELALWDEEFIEQLVHMNGHHASVNNVAFSPDGNTLLSADMDGNLILWDTPQSERVGAFYAHEGGVTNAVFSPDGRYVASGGNENNILVWDRETSQILLTLSEHTGYVHSLAFTPDGQYLLSGSADGTAKLWDITSGESIATFDANRTQVNSVAFNADGSVAILGTDGVSAVLWDTNPESETFGEVLRTFDDIEGQVYSVAYSPDGTRLAASNSNNEIYLWDAETGEQIQRIDTQDTGTVIDFSFSPDGETLVGVVLGGRMMLWDVDSGEVLLTFAGHRDGTSSAEFSPDGRTILSGGNDQQLILWDAETGQIIRTYIGHTSSVNSVAFSPDGRFAVSSSWDYSVRVWSIPPVTELINTLMTERYVPAFTCEQRTAYRVEPFCDIDGTVPTATAYPSLTPTVRAAGILPTMTSFPSSTPQATAVTASQTAEAGEQRGEIEVGGGEVWTYYGSYGEQLNIYVQADEPANDNEDREGLFDTYLIVRAPTGNVIVVADDIDSGIITDSYVGGLTLQTSGIYEIEIRSWDDQSGGSYTLIIESFPYVPTLTPTINPG